MDVVGRGPPTGTTFRNPSARWRSADDLVLGPPRAGRCGVDFCRKELLQMAFFDEIALFPIEPDYYNPLTATSIATVIFDREIMWCCGDGFLATREYPPLQVS